MYQEKRVRPIYVIGPIIAIICIVALLAVIDHAISNKKSDVDDLAEKVDDLIDEVAEKLEESREATDMANIRSAYADVVADYLTNFDETVTVTVYAQQTIKGWQTDPEPYLTYGASDGTSKDYYFPASVKGYVVGIEVYGDGWCRPVITTMD